MIKQGRHVLRNCPAYVSFRSHYSGRQSEKTSNLEHARTFGLCRQCGRACSTPEQSDPTRSSSEEEKLAANHSFCCEFSAVSLSQKDMHSKQVRSGRKRKSSRRRMDGVKSYFALHNSVAHFTPSRPATHGQIGVIVTGERHQTEVIFQNAKVWIL